MCSSDLNFVGAVVFSVIGIVYLKQRGKGKLASALIPQVNSPEVSQGGNSSGQKEKNHE